MVNKSLLCLLIASTLLFAGCFIEGDITDEYGVGIGGVTVTLGGDQIRVVTTRAGDGKYRFGNLFRPDTWVPVGNYTVTPSKSGYIFSPVSATDVTVSMITLQGTGEDVPWPAIGVDFESILTGPGMPLSLSQVDFFSYQIQGLDEDGAVDVLANSHYDMLVLEPTRTDWSSDAKYFDTKAMVAKLKNSKASDGIHRKLLIAYIDIGEAEDWRWYWTWSKEWDCIPPIPADWPDYILICDPDGWSGNYPIAYWDPRWKDIVIYGLNQDSSPHGDYNSIIDEVIKAGFDGIYLDWVEAFENQEVMAEAQRQGKDPAVEMINFIQEMRDYAEKRNPDFIIIQQNAASLIDGHPELSSVIDAIAQEAIWYDGDADVDWDDPNGYDFINDPSLVNYYIDYLDEYLDASVPIFNVEYTLNYENDAYRKSYDKGYLPYCTRRSLSKLTTTPPPGY